MKKTSLLVWVPLRPGSHWRAEGIAQTIENVLSKIHNINVTILVNKEHFYTLEEEFEGQDNISIVPLSFKWLLFKKISQRVEAVAKYNSEDLASYEISTTKNLIDMFLNKIFSKFQKINLFLTSIGYAVRLKTFTLLQGIGYFKQYQKIWLPVPIIPWIAQLKGETILSFWDPFGFEYREFGSIALYLHKNFLVTFNKVTHIITQSNNNKEYLTDVFGIDGSKISVVYLGYPNYSKFISIQNDTKKELLSSWKIPIIKSKNRDIFIQKLHKELINHSMLFRLKKRMNSKTKIIIISTQHRPYKGFETLFKILEMLIQSYTTNIYFIFTGLVPEDLKTKYAHFHENIVEINRVSNKQHALLYRISDLALHPSYAEGGLGTYPQFEAASVGTPCIINRGRHTDEMVKVFDANLSNIVCDFTDTETSVKKIIDLLENKELSLNNIELIMSSHRSWTTASKDYEKIFMKEL